MVDIFPTTDSLIDRICARARQHVAERQKFSKARFVRENYARLSAEKAQDDRLTYKALAESISIETGHRFTEAYLRKCMHHAAKKSWLHGG